MSTAAHGIFRPSTSHVEKRQIKLEGAQPDTPLAVLSPQMTEGRHCQVCLLDDRRLELLVQVGVATQGQRIRLPSVSLGGPAGLSAPQNQ